MAQFICGVDEAGRGPLAGPVYAAAVILDPSAPIEGLADSKKLSENKRLKLAAIIQTRALAWSIASATVEEIDTINILQATLLAMQRAVNALQVIPTQVLVDGNRAPSLAVPVTTIVQGDVYEPAISAASILAKTTRDQALLALHRDFPVYAFDQHKGYPTALHLARLQEYGPCSAHRRSFAPVASLLKPAELSEKAVSFKHAEPVIFSGGSRVAATVAQAQQNLPF
ncbi:ribonuclease HII [Parvibium lacunae]|uniref:Ribonuclease HII n=1 Tax=Parvibium lacunae TaxID=1888893 RepID=A0A368L7A8_9BURK|nr:ribonuclease HII [Parvibium lacunae]